MTTFKKNIQDIIGSEHLTKREMEEFAGLQYDTWMVKPPIFSDQVETLLENGYMISFMSSYAIVINKKLNASPESITSNKKFWRELSEAIYDKKENTNS